jgi:hypothetical protein
MRSQFRQRIKRTPAQWAIWGIFKSLSILYNLAFGGFDVMSSRRKQRVFAKELDLNFAEVFAKHPGEVVPGVTGDKAPPFGYVYATVEFPNARLQFTYGRKELDVRCSPQGAYNSWVEFRLIWDRASCGSWGEAPSCNAELGEVVQRIEAHWDELITEINS